MFGLLSEGLGVQRVANAQAAGTADVTTSSIDLASDGGDSFDSVLFLVIWGAITDGSPLVKAQQSSDDGVADAFADLEGSGVAVDLAADNKVTLLDIKRTNEQFIRAVIERGGGTGAVVDAVLAIPYDSRQIVTQLADHVDGHGKLREPIEGTA